MYSLQKISLSAKVFTLFGLLLVVSANGEVICSAKMNVGFALDASSKTGEENFVSTLKFAVNVSKYVNVDAADTWIFLAYGNQKRVFKTRSDLDSLMPEYEQFPNATETLLGATLTNMAEQFLDEGHQRDAVDIAILIASQISMDDIGHPAVMLKKQNATVFALGVGSDYSGGQLTEVASDPDSDYFIALSSWNGLDEYLAKKLARKICQVEDNCASSPCQNDGKCNSFKGSYNCTCSVGFYGDQCEKSRSLEYLSLGCFVDDANTHALISMENGNATFLDVPYRTRDKAVMKCALEAAKNDYKAFALQNGGECFSGSAALSRYAMYGDAHCPDGGKGGPLINEVYLLGAKCGKMLRNGLIHVSKSTVRGSSYKGSWNVPVLNGSYSWCPTDGDSRPYFEIDLGREVYLSKLFVQGKLGAANSMEKICVNYTSDSETPDGDLPCTLFEKYMSGQSGDYGYDHGVSPPFLIDSVRLAPSSNSNDGRCLRTDLEGCVTTVTEGEEVTKGCYPTQRNKCCVFPFWYMGHQRYSCIKDNHNQPWCATTDNYDRDQLWDNCQGISSPCDTTPCHNGGTCVENLEDWTYNCICEDGLSDGNCQDDYDECFNSPCQNEGTCVNTFGSYRCECNHGYSGKNCHLNCSYNKIELVFVVDGSSSIEYYGENNFRMMKYFMKNLTRSFSVSSSGTRVGVVVYSTNSTVVFTLNQYASPERVEEAIDNIVYPSGGTYSGKALYQTANKLFDDAEVRDNVPKVLVLLTDGVSTDDVIQPATLLSNKDVIVFVVGIGENINYSQLTQIAYGQSEHVFKTEFSSLGFVMNNIRGAICREVDGCSDNPCHFNGVCTDAGLKCTCAQGFQGDLCTEDVKECSEHGVSCESGKKCTEGLGGFDCTCSDSSNYGDNCDKDCSKAFTILFLLDSSYNVGEDNITRQVEFIITTALTFSHSSIGVIAYATDTQYLISPGNSSSFSEFANMLRNANYSMGKYKNLGKALTMALEETKLFDETTASVVVAMVAGKAEDDYAVPASLLRQRGVTIIGLPLGSHYSMSQLNMLVTKPSEEHLLKAEFADLTHFISTTRNKICKASNPCSSSDCSSAEICVNNYGESGGFRCVTDSCSLNPCQNGGNCSSDASGSYTCACPHGIGGQNCTEDIINECDSAPCIHGGTCINHLGHFECECGKDYAGTQCELACVNQKFNLIFVMDGSGSIESQGKGNFQRSKDFVIDMVQSFNIGKDDTHVAVVLYSEKAQVVLKLGKYVDEVEKIVDKIEEMSYPGGKTKTGYALDKVRKEVFKDIKGSRKTVPNVVMVLTDGLSHDDVEEPAEELRDEGATIISLGVGCCYDNEELREMASDPVNEHVFAVSFSALSEIKGLVREQICHAIDYCYSDPCLNGGTCISQLTDYHCECPSGWQGKDCETDVDECDTGITHCSENQVCQNFPGGSACVCSNNRFGANCTTQCKYTQFDVAFLLDTSGSINNAGEHNYQIMKDFIKGIVKSFVIGPDDTTVAVATFSSASRFLVQFDFTKYSTKEAIVDAVQNIPYYGGYTYTGNALYRVRTRLFPLARAGVPHILIVLTDGRANDDVDDHAEALRDTGVHIISVGVGNADHRELEEIASKPADENVFMASFDSVVSLASSILEDVCKVVDHCIGSPCRNNGTCNNLLNEYNCTCPGGFKGRSCEEVDHCYESPCKNNGTCYNFEANYTCGCPPEFKGKNCEDRKHCYDSPCLNDGTCHDLGDSYTCDCPRGFEGVDCEVVDHCSESPCQNNGTCLNLANNHTCDCVMGFTGKYCEAVDHCRYSPCLNNGTCQNFPDNYTCDCTPGFSGPSCETEDHCFDYPCQNNGTCHSNSENYTCSCLPSYTGQNCEAMDHCHYSPCLNNGTCQNFPDKYICDCMAGFSGRSCETKDHCFYNPCQNNGTCDSNPENYTCSCPPNYTGKSCEAFDHCHYSPCLNNGTCYNLPINFTCDCMPGFSGPSCEKVDYCYDSPCLNNGTCRSLLNNYTCACTEQFQGKNCEEKDHCFDSPCKNNGTCQNTVDGFQCFCQGMFSGRNCEQELHRCSYSPCLNNGTCVRLFDNYTCECPEGYNGQLCEETDYSYGNPCANNGSCIITADSFHCSCLLGFSGGKCETKDHCFGNPCLNNGTCQSNPENYTCSCPSSYTGQSCEERDYCHSHPCRHNGTCHNLPNDYKCECPSGLTGINCEEIDYCHENPCQNNGTCINDFEDYICYCPANFTGQNCEAQNYCYNSPCQNNGTCQNLDEGRNCTCASGYSGTSCEVVDPCFNNPCLNSGTCLNSENGYNCTCLAGFSGRNCEVEDLCVSLPCKNGGVCTSFDGYYNCDCTLGLRGKNCEEDIDECFNNPCLNGAYGCRNTFGSYECICAPNFTGIHCQIGLATDIFDLMFLFDGSAHLGYHLFRQTLQFANTILSDYNISQHQTNVAAAVYATTAVIGFNFTEHYNDSTVTAAIENLPFINETTASIENALRLARRQIFETGRENVPDVLVVFVGHLLIGDFKEVSKDLRDKGIKIVVVGIGDGYDIKQLDVVASEPKDDNVITIRDAHMDVMEGGVSGAVSQVVDPCASFPCRFGGNCSRTARNYSCSCPVGFEGPTCEEDVNECLIDAPNCTHGTSCFNTLGGYQCVCIGGRYGANCQYAFDTKLDIAFLIDGSLSATKETFLTFTSFANAVTTSLNVSEDETHASVTVYGDNSILVANLNDHFNQSSLEKAVDKTMYPASLQSNLGDAMLYVASILHNASISRPKVQKVLVILTASKSHDEIAVPSYLLLKNYNVTVFTIAVGSEYSLGQVKEISSDPDSDHILTYDSGKELGFEVAHFKERMAEALDPCSGNPCMNGTCESSESGYVCICHPGYSGMKCDKVHDPCNPDPCKNAGTCEVLPLNSYYCACSPGWTRPNCEEDIKECSLPHKICQNGGTCEERMGDYHCNCTGGYAGKNCDKVFKETMIDMVFMIDGSSNQNTGNRYFVYIINIIKFILGYLHDPNTRIGVVLYSSVMKTESYYNYTRNQTLQSLENLPTLPPGSLIGKSLNYTRQEFFNNSRKNAHRVLVVFTAGTSNDGVAVASKLLHNMNVTILVVAMGDWYDIKQVEVVASQPHLNTIVFTSYYQLVHMSWKIHEMICEAVDHCFSSPCMNNGTCHNSLHGYECACPKGVKGTHCEEVIDNCVVNNTCSEGQVCISQVGSHECVCLNGFYGKKCDKACNTTMDLVFLADGTEGAKMENFLRIIRLIKNVAKVLHVSEQGAHVGLVLYGDDSQIILNLNDHFSYTDLYKVISKIYLLNKKKRYVGKGLKYVKDEVFAKYGRNGVPKVIILLQNKRSEDAIGEISQAIKKYGVKIFAVGNGDKMAKGQLKEIASKPMSMYYKYSKSWDIDTALFTEEMKDSVCMALNPCSSSPCRNNSTCVPNEDGYRCNCPQGYSGSRCDQEISPCFPNPCQNGGHCIRSGYSYTCNCVAGFTSDNCEDDINECDSDPCQNNGHCNNLPGSYQCACPSGYLGTNCQSVCKHQKFNLAFLVDGSASMKTLNLSAAFQYKQLVKSVIDFYKVDKEDTNVGLVVYSSLTITKFTFQTHYAKPDINQMIDSMDYPANGTYTGSALMAVQNDLFAQAQSGRHNCLVTLTDGVSNDDVSLPSAHLRAMKVVTLAVGVGEFYAAEELQLIASTPSNVFEAPSYDQLPSTADRIKETLCNAVDHCYSNPCNNGGTCESLMDSYECACPSGYTGINCEMDINECADMGCGDRKICINFPGTSFCNCRPGFFDKENSCNREYSGTFNIGFLVYTGGDVDSYQKGNFKKLVGFVKGIVKTLKDDGDESRIGIIGYSDTPYLKNRLDNTTHSELEVELDNLNTTGKGRYIGKALELTSRELFNQSNGLTGRKSRDIVVVIVDGSSADDIAVPSFALKENNVTIFSVGIGRYKSGQLNEMASEPNSEHVFTTNDYEGLGPVMASLKDAIVKDVDPCSINPCFNGGSCVNHPSGNYTCICKSGWAGKQCEVDGSPCILSQLPCYNNGNCTIGDDGTPQCQCVLGWNGTNCEEDLDECTKNPCFNGGQCMNTPGSYYCKCPVKFTGEHCQTRCEGQFVNVGFLIDGSASVELSGSGNFNKTLEFVKGFIDYLDVSEDRAHVGLAVFSTDVYQVFNFGEYHNSSEAGRAVNGVRYPNQGRHIGKALNYMRHKMFSEPKLRRDVSNYLVLITSGSSYDLIRTPAKELRDKNVTIFAVGVGDDYDEDELREISGDDGRLVYRTTFDGLENLKTELKRKICSLEDHGTCNSSPCINEGTCINTGRNYRCECSRGYYGQECQFGCGFRELGLKVPNERRIPDDDITASSQKEEGRAAYRGRIGVETMGLWKDGWCASVIDTAPYLQVFFGYLTNVSVIETEGVTDDSTNSWVESYYVSMSNDSQPGSFVNYTEQGVTRIFHANDDIKGKNLSLEGTRAHYIRIHPVSFTGSSACVRIALYGCDSEDFPSSGILLQRVNNETPEESIGFDRIIAVIPAVFGALLLGGSLLFLIRYLRKRSSRQMKGYSTMEEEEGIYQTIPSDLPMYEVQTVAIEMGPDKALNSIGIWNEAYESYVGDEEEEEGIERHYQSLDDEEYEHIYENLPSAFEVQTLSVEVNGKEVVPGEVHSENAFYESVYPESKLEEKRRKQGFFELPRYRELSEEEDDDYDDNEDNGSDNEGYEDIYDNIFFPEEPSEDQKKRTLTFSPQQTAEDGIFSYENKIFSFDRRTTTLEEIQRKKSQVFPFL